VRIRRETAVFGALGAAAAVSVISSIKILTSNPEMYGLDLTAYVEAARRLMESGTPYAPQLHAGPLENVGTNIPIAYLYPPPLAQLFVPLSALPMPALAAGWALIQVILLAFLLPKVFARFGGVPDRRHVLAIGLAVIAFHPNLVALWVGNVSAWVAIMIAAMLVAPAAPRAAVAAAAGWLKLTPGAFSVGAFLDPATRIPTLVAGLGILAVSVVLSPLAWTDWLAVLPSLSGFFAQVPWTANLSPSHVLDAAGLPLVADAATVVLPAGFMLLVVVSALRGLTAAWIAAAAGAYLSATGTSWDHYFVALTPIAIAAWPGGSPAIRFQIVGVLVLFGPLRFLDSSWLYHLIGLALWLGFLIGAIHQFNGRVVFWSRGPVSTPTPALGSPE
jgi:hypothetical protein